MTRAAAFLVLIPLAGSAVGQKLTANEQAAALTGVREYVGSYTASLPNYTCIQITQEIRAMWAGLKPGVRLPIHTGFPTDVMEEQISFVDGRETRTVTRINDSGPLASEQAQIDPVSHGEFGNLLSTIFDPQSGTDLRWKRAATLDRRPVNVFEYHVPPLSGWALVGSKGPVTVPFEGLVYADRQTGAVVQVEMKCTGIPSGSEYKAMNLTLNYKPAKIAGREHLLPSGFVIHYETTTGDGTIGAEFKSCRQFNADSTITFDGDSGATGAANVTEITKTAPPELPPAPVAEAKAPLPDEPAAAPPPAADLRRDEFLADVSEPLAAAAQQPPGPAVFRSETRLVS